MCDKKGATTAVGCKQKPRKMFENQRTDDTHEPDRAIDIKRGLALLPRDEREGEGARVLGGLQGDPTTSPANERQSTAIDDNSNNIGIVFLKREGGGGDVSKGYRCCRAVYTPSTHSWH